MLFRIVMHALKIAAAKVIPPHSDYKLYFRS